MLGWLPGVFHLPNTLSILQSTAVLQRFWYFHEFFVHKGLFHSLLFFPPLTQDLPLSLLGSWVVVLGQGEWKFGRAREATHGILSVFSIDPIFLTCR